MRIKLQHRISFEFKDAARGPMFLLRLTPRSHEGQRINSWRIDVSPDCLLKAGEDHFGNITHMLSVPGVVSDIAITVQGEISTYDAVGVVRGTAERMPPDIYLRDTSLTSADQAVREFAETASAGSDDTIGKLHALMGAIHARLGPEIKDCAPVGARHALRGGPVCADDHAHLFVTSVRGMSLPARCVSGYFIPNEGKPQRHAWAEVHVAGLGWIGFDTVNDLCPEESHIRTAVGLDSCDAAAVRGLRLDNMTETLDFSWLLKREQDNKEAASQSQSQSA